MAFVVAVGGGGGGGGGASRSFCLSCLSLLLAPNPPLYPLYQARMDQTITLYQMETQVLFTVSMLSRFLPATCRKTLTRHFFPPAFRCFISGTAGGAGGNDSRAQEKARGGERER